MKVGDLVRLKHSFSLSGRVRPAIVVNTDGSCLGYCEIVFADTNERVKAKRTNLRLANESR